MDSMSGLSSGAAVMPYTLKQQKLIDELSLVISKTGINLVINPSDHVFIGLGPFSCDVEHDEQGNLVGIGLCTEKRCYYFTNTRCKAILENNHLICHNGISDFECLRMWGINVRDEQLIFDTMLLGHILDSSLKSYSLKDMACRELGIEYPSYDDIVGKRGLKAERITLDKQPLELVAKYNALDTYCTYQLYLKQRKALNLETL